MMGVVVMIEEGGVEDVEVGVEVEVVVAVEDINPIATFEVTLAPMVMTTKPVMRRDPFKQQCRKD